MRGCAGVQVGKAATLMCLPAAQRTHALYSGRVAAQPFLQRQRDAPLAPY